MVAQGVSLLLHFLGGCAIELVAEYVEVGDGVGIAAAVGMIKEISDVNFNIPDAIAWPAGAAVCRAIKSMPTEPSTWKTPETHFWYMKNA